MNIIHIITGLSVGGAENMLYKLIKNTKTKNNHKVVSLTKNGQIGIKLKDIGIKVKVLNMKNSLSIINKFNELRKYIKKENPDIIQTWMYHSDLIGGGAGKLGADCPIVWNIRHSNLEPDVNKKTTIWTAKISAKLSNIIPDKIASCSLIAKNIHSDLGYNKDKIEVIPNGFDLSELNKNLYDKNEIYEELEIPFENNTIAMVGRYNPQKDYENLINAANKLRDMNENLFSHTNFILCGRNVDVENKGLVEQLNDLNLRDRFHLLGQRNDIPKIMASIDLFTLSSSCGEGFPNVIGEAMASSTPCIVTDVGDSAYIVGDTGIVVPPKEPNKLAEGWNKILSLDFKKKKRLNNKARLRIEENFDIKVIAKRYIDLYNSLILEYL